MFQHAFIDIAADHKLCISPWLVCCSLLLVAHDACAGKAGIDEEETVRPRYIVLTDHTMYAIGMLTLCKLSAELSNLEPLKLLSTLILIPPFIETLSRDAKHGESEANLVGLHAADALEFCAHHYWRSVMPQYYCTLPRGYYPIQSCRSHQSVVISMRGYVQY
jgi:hypothetical protein